MKISLILFVINLVIVVQSDDRTARHIDYVNTAEQAEPCKREPFECRALEEEPSDCQDCKEPCKCIPYIKDKAFTKLVRQEITKKFVLTCTTDSYYDSIEFEGTFNASVSCNAVFRECYGYVYTGVKTLPNGNKIRHSLNSKKYCNTIAITNGNVILNERAVLNDCQCDGDVLSNVSEWVADDPINGCRPGNELTAVAFKLKIFGKCCSECNLQFGKIT